MISIEPVDARGAPDEQGGRTVRASSVCNLILWSSYVVKIQVIATVLGLVGGAPSNNSAGRGRARMRARGALAIASFLLVEELYSTR